MLLWVQGTLLHPVEVVPVTGLMQLHAAKSRSWIWLPNLENNKRHVFRKSGFKRLADTDLEGQQISSSIELKISLSIVLHKRNRCIHPPPQVTYSLVEECIEEETPRKIHV